MVPKATIFNSYVFFVLNLESELLIFRSGGVDGRAKAGIDLLRMP